MLMTTTPKINIKCEGAMDEDLAKTEYTTQLQQFKSNLYTIKYNTLKKKIEFEPAFQTLLTLKFCFAQGQCMLVFVSLSYYFIGK